MTCDPVEIVRGFLGAWHQGAVDELLAFFAPDGVYHNIPMEPWTGHEAIRVGLEAFMGMAHNIDSEVRNIGVAGHVVFTERIDRFDLAGGHVDMPCVGVFEVVDEKIAAWRDYFDMAMFTKQSSAG